MDERQNAAAPPITSVALTGATGFIGYVLQTRLVADGLRVRALVRPGSRNRARIAPGVEVVEVSLEDRAELGVAVRDVDAIVHAAGTVRGCDYADFRAANVDGLENVCRAASARERPPWLLLISSLAASRPELSHYARSKCEGEGIAQRYRAGTTILRPPAVYGPGDREMLPLFRAIRAGIALIVGPRGQCLSLLYVDDLAQAVAACLRRPASVAGNTYAIDDGRENGYGWPDIVAAARGRIPVLRVRIPRGLLNAIAHVNVVLARGTGRAPMLTPGKVRELSEESWLCNNQAFTSATGWYPEVPLAEGVHRLFSAQPQTREH